MINDAFKSLGRNREVKNDEVNQFVKAIDKNGDGKVSKSELFEILKKLINGGWILMIDFPLIILSIEFIVHIIMNIIMYLF